MATEPRRFDQLSDLQRDLIRLQFGADFVAAGTAWIFDGGIAYVTLDVAARPEELPPLLRYEGE